MTQGHVHGSTVLLAPHAESILAIRIKIVGICFVFVFFFSKFIFGFSSNRNDREIFDQMLL